MLEMCLKFFLVNEHVIRTYTVMSFMLHGKAMDDVSSPYGFSEVAVISVISTVAVTGVMLVFLLVRLAIYHAKDRPPTYERIVPGHHAVRYCNGLKD